MDQCNKNIAQWKKNIQFVLVEPVESGNIGSSARAIKNMGFADMALVGVPGELGDEARWLARNSMDVLYSAKRFDTLTECIGPRGLVVGTSRRRGKRRTLMLPLHEAAMKVVEAAQTNEVAILFGREKRGLFNDEIDQCGLLAVIPTGDEQPSLNLAHAVLIMAYELHKQGLAHATRNAPSDTPRKLSTFDEMAVVYEQIEEVLTLLEYSTRGDRDLHRKIMLLIKQLLSRAEVTERERFMLYGLCSRAKSRLSKSSKA